MGSTATDRKSQLAQSYDLIAEQYLAWSSPRATLTRQKHLETLISHLPQNSATKILELGCGAGVPCTQFLLSHDFAVTGVDISTAQIELAKTHVPEATLIKADMIDLEFPDESFDAIVGFYSIFHLPMQDQDTIIQRISKWLKKGGWFLGNFAVEEGDVVLDNWMHPKASMFYSGRGVEGTRALFAKEAKNLKLIVDEVDLERDKDTKFEESFHWIMAQKRDGDI